MTREEAIKQLNGYVKLSISAFPKDLEALDMAIEALNQQKEGIWIDKDGDNAICGCCNRLNHLYGQYCKHCGVKMKEGE